MKGAPVLPGVVALGESVTIYHICLSREDRRDKLRQCFGRICHISVHKNIYVCVYFKKRPSYGIPFSLSCLMEKPTLGAKVCQCFFSNVRSGIC